MGTTALHVDKSTRQGTALCVDIRNEQGMAWEEWVISSTISSTGLGIGLDWIFIKLCDVVYNNSHITVTYENNKK